MYFTLVCCIIVMAILNQVMAYPLKVNVNTTCECGHLVHVEDRIVGGSMTTPHLYPWMVAILNGGRLHCGGSAINNLYILTAGHCLKWANKDELMVVLGMHDRVQMEEGTEKFVKIDSLIIHESFTSDYLHDTDDIGLVKLKEPIVWDETVQPICLPKPGSDYRGQLGMVTGWGRTAQNGNPARYLRRAGVKIVHEDRCKNTTIGDHIRETMLCAYEYNTDACQGDSGGPLGYETKTGMVEQIGVVSWGIGCARPGIPGIYTKLTEYLDWIKAHTKDAWYCEKRF